MIALYPAGKLLRYVVLSSPLQGPAPPRAAHAAVRAAVQSAAGAGAATTASKGVSSSAVAGSAAGAAASAGFQLDVKAAKQAIVQVGAREGLAGARNAHHKSTGNITADLSRQDVLMLQNKTRCACALKQDRRCACAVSNCKHRAKCTIAGTCWHHSSCQQCALVHPGGGFAGRGVSALTVQNCVCGCISLGHFVQVAIANNHWSGRPAIHRERA